MPDATPRTSFLFYYRKNSLEAVRDGRYKLVFAHPGRSYEAFPPGNGGRPGKVAEGHEFPLALYDMRRDPGERYDVQNQHPEVVEELMRIADAAREDLGDDLRGMPGRQGRINDEGQVRPDPPLAFAARETDYLRSFPVSAKADFTSCSFC